MPSAPFKILRELGRGGMGEVYEVALPGDPRPHVAKLLTHLDAMGLERFRREGELVARLDDHPGIVRIGSMGVLETGTPYLVFERVEGQPLGERMAEGPLPVADALQIARELSEALAHAHARGVVHRDVKPDNVILEGSSDRVRLLDFGIAIASDMTRLTQSTFTVGTPNYMACEQVAGSDQAQGPWTDVHAVGLILYECLVGSSAFTGRDPMTLMAQVVCSEPAPVSDARDDVTPALDAVVERCLLKTVSERYPSCAELAADLARLERGEAPEALGAARGRTLRTLAARASAIAAMALVIGAALFAAQQALAPAPAPAAQEAIANLGPARRALARGALASARDELNALLAAHPEAANRGDVARLGAQLDAREAEAAVAPDPDASLNARYRACLPDDFVGLRAAASLGPVPDPDLARRVARAWLAKANRDMAVHGHTDAWFAAVSQAQQETSLARQHLEDYARTSAEAVRAAPQVDLLGFGEIAWVLRLALARGLEVSGRGGSSPTRTHALTAALLAQSPNDPSLLAAASLSLEDGLDPARALELSTRALRALAHTAPQAGPFTRHARDQVAARHGKLLVRLGDAARASAFFQAATSRDDCGPRLLLAQGAELARKGDTLALGQLRERLTGLRGRLSDWSLSEAHTKLLARSVDGFLAAEGPPR